MQSLFEPWTITNAATLLQQGQLSAMELTEALLARCSTYQHLGAYINLMPEIALQEAQCADDERRRGIRHGLLHGIPLAIKDLIDVAGVPTTAGTATRRQSLATADAFVIQRLRNAGAIILGKTNLSEWAMEPTNENETYGPALNPWNHDHTCGGSSGGSAVAVAARLALGAIGSDTGGSIRIPAAFCGIVGLKPTYGRVSVGGVLPLSWNLDHIGPLANTVQDAAILLQAIAGHNPDDPWSAQHAVPDFSSTSEAGVRGLRLGVLRDDYFANLEAGVQTAFEAAVEHLHALGAQIEPVELTWAAEARKANSFILVSDAASFHHERMASDPLQFEAGTRADLERGATYPATAYAWARQRQHELRLECRRLFQHYDALLCPTTPILAHRRDEPSFDPLSGRSSMSFMGLFNLLGLPALSVPCGFDAGLPIGLQVIGPVWEEARLVQIGIAWEQTTQWQRHPSLSHGGVNVSTSCDH